MGSSRSGAPGGHRERSANRVRQRSGNGGRGRGFGAVEKQTGKTDKRQPLGGAATHLIEAETVTGLEARRFVGERSAGLAQSKVRTWSKNLLSASRDGTIMAIGSPRTGPGDAPDVRPLETNPLRSDSAPGPPVPAGSARPLRPAAVVRWRRSGPRGGRPTGGRRPRGPRRRHRFRGAEPCGGPPRPFRFRKRAAVPHQPSRSAIVPARTSRPRRRGLYKIPAGIEAPRSSARFLCMNRFRCSIALLFFSALALLAGIDSALKFGRWVLRVLESPLPF